VTRRKYHWTPREDDVLRMHWGARPVAEVATILERSAEAVYQRAGKIGLGLGCPQGFEYLHNAALRVGHDPKTLRRILRWARVPIREASADPKSSNVRHVVEPYEVDEAMALWGEHETPAEAAHRTGFDEHTMRRLLRAAIARGELKDERPASGRHWLVRKSVVDKIVAARLRAESAAQATKRVGVSYPTLHKWLKASGIAHGRGIWLDPDVVDRVVEAKRAAGSRAFRVRDAAFSANSTRIVEVTSEAA
jgi:transposase